MIETSRHNITFNPVVQICMEEGGYVAGGAARSLFLRKNMREYFQVDEFGPKSALADLGGFQIQYKCREKPAGDVDVFFPTRESHSAAIARLKRLPMTMSDYSTGLSTTFHVPMKLPNNKEESVAVQLVHCVFGPARDMISNFDFVNCAVALSQRGFIYDSEVPLLEDKRALKIRRGDSTQMLKRVMKYMNYRGLETVEDSTRDIITEWIRRYVSGDFAGPTSKLSSRPPIQLVESAIGLGVMNKEHLTYLVNRREFDITLSVPCQESGYKVVGKANQIHDLIGKLSA